MNDNEILIGGMIYRKGKITNIFFNLEKTKVDDVTPYIDEEKGWKLTEKDQDRLIEYYQDWIDCCMEHCGGDFADEPEEVLYSIMSKGVEASKDLIQETACLQIEAVCGDIYKYHKNDTEILWLVENSLLDMDRLKKDYPMYDK